MAKESVFNETVKLVKYLRKLMNLKQLKKNWEELGESDPFWAVLTNPKKINNKWTPEEFYKTGQKRINRIFKILDIERNLKGNTKAFDFGCGPGRLTQALCQKFEQVVGADISSTMIEEANKHNKFPESCIYLTNNTNDLTALESNQFDFVLSYITLQHIENKYTLNYIKEFARIVKKGGLIAFNIPYRPPIALKIFSSLFGLGGVNLIRQLYYRKKSIIEMHWISEKEIIDLADDLGMAVLQISNDKSVGRNWGSNLYLLRKS